MTLRIRAGYELSYDCQQPTPMILTLNVHPSRRHDLLTPDNIRLAPAVPISEYRDGFGNTYHVIRAPQGKFTISADFLIQDTGKPDDVVTDAKQHLLEALPVETLVYLLGSRYCETDRLSDFAWSKFGALPRGWSMVQAICDFVHDHIAFGYEHAHPTKSAVDAFEQ